MIRQLFGRVGGRGRVTRSAELDERVISGAYVALDGALLEVAFSRRVRNAGLDGRWLSETLAIDAISGQVRWLTGEPFDRALLVRPACDPLDELLGVISGC